MRVAYASVFAAITILSGCPGGGGSGGSPDGGDDGGDSESRCEVGSERCKCTRGGACDEGLTCLSDICVDLDDEPEGGGGGGGGRGGTGGRIGLGGEGGSSGAGGAGGSTGGAGGSIAMGDPTDTLNAMVILPNEGAPLNNPQTDDTVVIQMEPTDTQPLMPGSTVNVAVPFSASSANVVAAGIRFGSSGPIRTVMLPQAMGQSSATLAFDMMIPPSVCADLANICHNIQCYEFAVTDAGRISRENIMDLALLCSNCTEPTCQALLPPGACMVECMTADECDPGEACSMGLCVGEGALRFTLTWSATTDLDLHVITPTSNEIYFGNPSGDSGSLDRDNTSGGGGSVENIFFTAPPVGSYTYYVRNYNGAAAASFTLQVFKDGALAASQTGSLPAASGDSTQFMISVP